MQGIEQTLCELSEQQTLIKLSQANASLPQSGIQPQHPDRVLVDSARQQLAESQAQSGLAQQPKSGLNHQQLRLPDQASVLPSAAAALLNPGVSLWPQLHLTGPASPSRSLLRPLH